MSEKYTGVKFKTFFIEEVAPENDQKLKQLMSWCNVFQKNNLTPIANGASSGNLSFRLQPGSNVFVITGTQLALNRRLSPSDFVSVWDIDFTKQMVYAEGLCEPSSESMLHYSIYKMRPDVNAIFHGHSDFLLSNSAPNTPITKKEAPYGTQDMVGQVLQVLQANNYLLIKNHGFLSLGGDMNFAGNQVLEMLGKIEQK
ncbi:MAG: class II aldolase/adducin family protein [Bacteroidota bacterium]